MKTFIIFYLIMTVLNIIVILSRIAKDDYPQKRADYKLSSDVVTLFIQSCLGLWAGILIYGAN